MLNLVDEPDNFVWNLTHNGESTVKCMYEDQINRHTTFLRTYLWKLETPSKIKVFMWFLNNVVFLTKDNPVKPKSQGCRKCYFCDSVENIEQFYISYPFAKLMWSVVFSTYNIPPRTNIKNMFQNLLTRIGRMTKSRIRIVVSAICWSIWDCRNNIFFKNSKNYNVLQVIDMEDLWIRLCIF